MQGLEYWRMTFGIAICVHFTFAIFEYGLSLLDGVEVKGKRKYN